MFQPLLSSSLCHHQIRIQCRFCASIVHAEFWTSQQLTRSYGKSANAIRLQLRESMRGSFGHSLGASLALFDFRLRLTPVLLLRTLVSRRRRAVEACIFMSGVGPRRKLCRRSVMTPTSSAKNQYLNTHTHTYMRGRFGGYARGKGRKGIHKRKAV